LPGSSAEIAVKRVGCSIEVNGHVLMNGICHYRTNIETADVFMTLPEAATQISFTVSRRAMSARAVTLWVQTHGTRGLGLLREEKITARGQTSTATALAGQTSASASALGLLRSLLRQPRRQNVHQLARCISRRRHRRHRRIPPLQANSRGASR
jgi:hypothetical protein